MKNRLSSLPLQLLVFVGLPLLVLPMAVAIGGVALHQAAMREMLVDHNRQIVSGAATSLSDQLMLRQAALAELVTAVGDSDAAPDLLAQASWLHHFFDGGVTLYSNEGQPLATIPADQPIPAGRLPVATSFTAYRANDTTALSILIATPPDETHLRAAGVVSLHALSADSILASLNESGSTEVYLLATDGTVLFHSDPAWVGQTLDHVVPQTQGASRARVNEQDVILTVAPVTATGWTLVQEERWQETLSPVMRYSQAAPLVLVPGLLIAIAAVWLGIQRIVYPLRQLEAQATELAWGDFDAIEQQVGGIAEIRRLQATLQHMARRVQTAQTNMHDYIGAITHAQEDERRRLARELHDQTAQALVALDHRQQMLKPYLKDEPAAETLLAEIRGMIVETINDLRRIVRALRPIYLEELGLAPALQTLARDLALDDRVKVHFEQHGSPKRLAPEHEIALYRIAQEALNNAWQHAHASHIWLAVRFEDTHVQVSVRDNGQGFEAPRHAAELGASGRKHFGIMGMYERAALIGAHLQVQSEPGAGTTITVRAPLASA